MEEQNTLLKTRARRICLAMLGITTIFLQEEVKIQEVKIQEVKIQAAVLPNKGKLNVSCSRSYYCNPVHCQPVRMKEDALARHDYDEISRFLFLGSHSSNNRTLRFQYWGDSIQATLECDMRQWIYESSAKSTKLTSEYLQVGCPWRKCTPYGGWKKLTLQTQTNVDIIIFTIGAHYEFLTMNKYQADLDKFYDVLEPFLNKRGNGKEKVKALLVLSPSPTNFNTSDGLYFNTSLKKDIGKTEQCVPIPKIPTIVTQQREALRTFINRLKNSTISAASSSLVDSPAPIVEFVDVYSFSMSRPLEHLSERDCKHYCQNCGILRAWNALILDKLMNLNPATETIFDFFGG